MLWELGGLAYSEERLDIEEPVEAVELLKSRLNKCRTNAEFLMTMNLD